MYNFLLPRQQNIVKYALVLILTFGPPALAQDLGVSSDFPPSAQEPEEIGISDDRILFGQSAALRGPAAALGMGMRLGIEAAFAEINAAGGIHGRRLELLALDDGYEPSMAAQNTETLLTSEGVFGLIGIIGTPTAVASQPIATAAGAPFIGAFTGAGFLRHPDLRNVVNIRASYDAETDLWVDYLMAQGRERFALLYQDDAFGRVGLSGVSKALDARGSALVAQGTYMRNTLAVKAALLDIRRADPDVVTIVGAYAPVAEFIRWAREIGLNTEFITISFVGSAALASALGDHGSGVYITQVVPFPWDDSIPMVAAYQAALAALDASAEPEFISLEGYMTGLLTAQVLEATGPNPTRESFLDTLYSVGTFDLGGVTLNYGPGDNEGMSDVFLTRITDTGGFEPISHAP